MQQYRRVSLSTVIDWLGYIGLFVVGIYFILKDEVLHRFQLGRTNYAHYEEPMSDRPTIVSFFAAFPPLKYGVDYNISYLVYSPEQNVQIQEFNLTPGENQVTGEGVFDFEETQNGVPIKLTPITPPNKHNRIN